MLLFGPVTSVSLLAMNLQAVDEACLQVVNVVRGLYGNVNSTVGLQKGGVFITVTHVVATVEGRVAVWVPPVEGAVGAMGRLIYFQVRAPVCWWEVAVLLEMLGPRAVTGAVGGAVRHQACLQAAIAPHGPVQVQLGDQRLPDVHLHGPVY